MGVEMSWWEFFTGDSASSDSELPEIFPFPLSSKEFIECDIKTTYTMILTDAMERVEGLAKEQEPALWDSCLQSENSVGLISLLAEAMADTAELFLVYKAGVLRKATQEEQEKIRADYKTTAKSSTGVFISFKGYRRTKMLKIYSALEYCVLAALNKLVNLAKAVQIKINELRSSASLADSSIAGNQAKALATSLRAGKDIALDAKDLVESASPDITPTEKAIAFLDSKRAWILSLPLAYVSGAQTAGIGSTGEADMRATERGLKQYFTSILQPVLKAVFNKDTEFKSQDFREIGSAMDAVKTFELAGNTLVSLKSQQNIVCQMLGLDPDEERKQIEKEGDLSEEEEQTDGNPDPSPDAQNGSAGSPGRGDEARR